MSSTPKSPNTNLSSPRQPAGGFMFSLPTTSTKLKMQSFLSKAKGALMPSGSSGSTTRNGVVTERNVDKLFTVTKPEIDGDECLKDCDSCTVSMPRKWEIDEEDKLYGHVKGWDTHLIVATGKADWVRDVVDEKGSLMESVGKHGLELSNGKVMLSASDMPTGNECDTDLLGRSVYPDQGKTRCLVLPKWRFVENVTHRDVPWLMDEVIAKGATNLSPLHWQETAPEKVSVEDVMQNGTTKQTREDQGGADVSEPADLVLTKPLSNGTSAAMLPAVTAPDGVQIEACGHRAIILMCSHKTRDWRCGASAPLLKKEFERHLRPLGLYRDHHDERPGGVGIYFINHVGGHKYSANVMIYRRESSETQGQEEQLADEAVQGIWLARVRPEDCENIVRYTVLQGKLVKPLRQLRGGFDRSCGKVSW